MNIVKMIQNRVDKLEEDIQCKQKETENYPNDLVVNIHKQARIETLKSRLKEAKNILNIAKRGTDGP